MMGGDEEFVTKETCEATSSQLLESQEQLHTKLDSIEKRLFRDNGSVSIQTSVKSGHSRDLSRKLNAPGERLL